MERDNLGGGEQADEHGDDQTDAHGLPASDPAAAPGPSIPAPQLRETADIWFDTGRDPVIRWDPTGSRFELVDPLAADEGLVLYEAPRPPDDPARIARALAEGLAACDFPPTGVAAVPGHVAAALRAVGIDPERP